MPMTAALCAKIITLSPPFIFVWSWFRPHCLSDFECGGCNVSSISRARNSYLDIEASRSLHDESFACPSGFRSAVQLFAVALTSTALAACAQSTAISNKSELLATSRQASLEDNRNASSVMNRRYAPGTKFASYGVASFYVEGTETASGEKFDPHELTAAHPTLPFGTRLRVTNVATGRFVIVRVNDRGPFIPGRVVDVSYAAAQTLGIIGRGIAKVKLDVVQ
jgi:rare lipoprotein A